MKFALVRKEPSRAMWKAAARARDIDGESIDGIVKAGIAASEPPADTELRELARLMWSDKPYWGRPDLPKSQPTEALCQIDIDRMKRFLAALGDKHD